MEVNKIYNEDCIDTMKKMPDNFIDLVLTSPPYDEIREYGGHSGFDFKHIANELFRVIKDGGRVVWIVMDQTKDFDESGTSFRQALYFKEVGFKLNDTMIFLKPAGVCSQSAYGYRQCAEYMFLLSKGKPAVNNYIKDRCNYYFGKRFGVSTAYKRAKDGSQRPDPINWDAQGEYAQRGNCWFYLTGSNLVEGDEFAFEHPAIFHEQLARDHIISWTNKNMLVYDPFMGSGTTAKMAIKENRDFIGSEINRNYFELANKRIATVQGELL